MKARNRVIKDTTLDWQQVYDELLVLGARLAPWIADTSVYLAKAAAEGRAILYEGAQGTMLDIDHGTYPFVTSSNASIGGVCTGLGVPPRAIGTVLGVVKAYTTRVGEGPLPTELTGELGQRLRESGQEYGASTGRPRRCGWYDAVAVRFSTRVNGIDALALTKLDVLDGLPSISICTAYRCGSTLLDDFPSDLKLLATMRAGIRRDAWLVGADERRPLFRRASGRRARLHRPPRATDWRSRRNRLDGIGPRRDDRADEPDGLTRRVAGFTRPALQHHCRRIRPMSLRVTSDPRPGPHAAGAASRTR